MDSVAVKTKSATMAVNKYGERVVKMRFSYDIALLDKVRTIPGRTWHSEIKCWSAPIHLESLKSLLEWGFVLDDNLMEFIQDVTHKKEKIFSGVSGLQGTPYPFQNEGIAFIDHNDGRALIADEMGLGKTIQAIAWLQMHPEKRPAIIIVPAFLKLNWERELAKWMPNPDSQIVKGTTPHTTKGKIIIINYDILPHWTKVLRLRDPKVIITDECHYYKSDKAKRTKAVKMLAKGVPHFIALSGTPIENRPIEIFNAVSLIEPTLFPKKWDFLRRYCDPKHNGYGWNFNGASHMPELHTILSTTVMIRRKKKDVLKDLPEKVWALVPMELTNLNEYHFAESNFIQWVQKEKGTEAAVKASNAEVFSSIEALKQLAVQGKLEQATEWIENFLESGKKLVVFATHHFVVDAIMERFSKVSVKVDGRVSMTNRQEAVDRFQNDPAVQLFIGNIDAAGVGITLTAASDVAFLELPWTPGKLEQASDRVHRIGQKDSVTVYYLLASNTIEEKIAQLIDNKRKVLDAILDGKDTEEESMLTELLKTYM